MPFYDYKCPSCERVFEIQKGMSDNPKVNCPHCNYKDCQRVFTPIKTLGAEHSGGGCTSCSDGVCSSCGHK